MEAPRRIQKTAPEPQAGSRNRNRLLAVIATVLVIFALKYAQTVALPLAFSLFFIAIFWPLQKTLEERMPRGAAVVLNLLAFLAVVAGFAGALWYAGHLIAVKSPQYATEFDHLMTRAQRVGARFGITIPDGGISNIAGVRQVLLTLSGSALAAFGGFILVTTYFVIGLLEVHDYRSKVDHAFGEQRGSRWLAVGHKAAIDFQRYVIVRGAVALLTGVLTFTFSLLAGLDFAFVWGLSTFILEFIPTIGTILAMIPPIVFALFEFGFSGRLALVFAGISTIQLVMGHFIEPLVEGKYLKLSPFVVLVAIAFWGWVWGIGGAFIALPLTMLIVLLCRQFESTRTISAMLACWEPPKIRSERDVRERKKG